MKVINTYWGFFCIQYKDRKPCSNKMRTKKYHTVVNMLLSQQDMFLEYEELEETKGVDHTYVPPVVNTSRFFPDS
jgi:hypothetical protein